MFTSTDSSKKKFLENTRLEREKRENERLEKIQLEKKTKAAIVIQHVWKKRQCAKQAQIETWSWWSSQVTKEFDILHFLQWVGLYCFMTKERKEEVDMTRLKMIVKYFTTSKFRRDNKLIPFYTLLIDMRFMDRARKYLTVIINQCITTTVTATTNDIDNKRVPEIITFLLQYLNPKTYSTKHVLDNYHVIDLPDKILISIAQSILKSTLCSFQIRDAFIQCVEQIIKLQDRANQQEVKGLKLWLTTMTRLTLYPIENAELTSDALDLKTASKFLILNTLSVPCITSLVNTIMVDRLRLWTLNVLLQQNQLENDLIQELGGNGCLFLLANFIDLWNNDKNTLKQEQELQLVELTRFFLNYIEPWFSDRQTPSFSTYHPIFKWAKSTNWGNTIHQKVFENVMKQLEYIWSRSFMDQLFQDIILYNNFKQQNKMNWIKKQAATNGVIGSSTEGNMALFSIEVESNFSMYIQLGKLFKAHRKIIFYRIAFTHQLMPQLWKLMNRFGPRGNMVIYLDAATKSKDIDKEPLVQVLKVFCEACSIVFL